MTINPKIVIITLAILALSLFGNYYFYSQGNDNSKLRDELERSKGRVEILMEESAKSTMRMDSLKKIISSDTIEINRIKGSIKVIAKSYAVEKNHIANLPIDSAVLFFAKRYATKKAND